VQEQVITLGFFVCSLIVFPSLMHHPSCTHHPLISVPPSTAPPAR
jgi:hypothetical protein